jgi:hypothetical protein
MRVALVITLNIRDRVMIGCSTSRGGFFMTSRSTGSTPKLEKVTSIWTTKIHLQLSKQINKYIPLSGGTIHDDVDPQYLHCVQRIGKFQKCWNCNKRYSSNTPKQINKKLERFSFCRFQCDFLLLTDVKEWINNIRDWFTRSHRSEGEDENRNPKKGFKCKWVLDTQT